MSKARDLANIAGSSAFEAADETKLDGIEASADVTDAANVEPLVDAHLNTSTATSGEFLSWNGLDYDWAEASGGTTGIDDNATSTAVTIDSSGNVGIGTSSPSSYSSSIDDLVVYNSASGGITIATGTSSQGAIAFADGTSGGDPLRGRIRYDHSNDSMGFRVNNAEAMTVTSTGLSVTGNITATGSIAGGISTWVNFNGSGSVAIRDDGNVSSITDNSTGSYTVNFTTSQSNANYCCNFSATDNGTTAGQTSGFAYGSWVRGGVILATGSVYVAMGYPANSSKYDQSHVNVSIVGG